MGQGATTSHNPIQVDPDACIRCMICDYVCPGDIIHKKPRSRELPVIEYPDECWYCGMCEQACPTSAITVVFPENMLSCQTPVRSLLGSELTDALPGKNQ
jgi:adenylylsulfate reductase subunit B